MKDNYLNNLLKLNPFNHNKNTKNLFNNIFKKLTNYHIKNSSKYRKFIQIIKNRNNSSKINALEFYLTTDAFKHDNISSVDMQKISKKVESSGTSKQKKSQIFLDRKNSLNQRIVLSKIISSILGNKRLPMIIIESKKSFYKKGKDINAKIAAINGFSNFGKDHFFLLNDKDEIDYENFKKFINKNKYKKIFIFGFTFDVYEYLYEKLNKDFCKNFLKNAILLHGGGWKKLEDKKISNVLFKNRISNKLKIEKIYNYYGMIEQAGSIFLECGKCNYLKNSIYSDIYIRNKNLDLEKNNKTGIVQVLSLIPTSYPGHNLLTSDEGKILECECGAKRFEISGRVQDTEIRGCSNI